MPTVCHLDRIRCSLPDRFGIGWRSISAHNFDFRVTDQPWNKAFGCPVCQEIHDPTPFQIDRGSFHSVVPCVLPNRPHPTLEWVLRWIGQLAQHSIDHGIADPNPITHQQQLSDLCAHVRTDTLLFSKHSLRFACIAHHEIRKLLGKSPFRTGWVVTEEPFDLELNNHRPLCPGQIPGIPQIMAVEGGALLLTLWTGCTLGCALDPKSNFVFLYPPGTPSRIDLYSTKTDKVRLHPSPGFTVSMFDSHKLGKSPFCPLIPANFVLVKHRLYKER